MNLIKLLRQDTQNIIHNPALVFSNTLLPLVLIGVMGFITKGVFGTTLVSSYDFYGVNMMIFSVALLVAITATNSFMEENVKRGNLRISYSPISKTDIYISKVLSTYLLTTVSYGLLIPFCQYVLHINMGKSHMFSFILLLNVFSFFSCSFGTMFCCIFRSEEQANAIMQIPVLLFSFLGGVFFQVHRFGTAVRGLSSLSPVKWVANCSYHMIYDGDTHLLVPVILTLLALSFLFLCVCQLLFKPEEYL